MVTETFTELTIKLPAWSVPVILTSLSRSLSRGGLSNGLISTECEVDATTLRFKGRSEFYSRHWETPIRLTSHGHPAYPHYCPRSKLCPVHDTLNLAFLTMTVFLPPLIVFREKYNR